MPVVKTQPSPLQFSYIGRFLEVRAAPLETGWTIRVFEGAKAATGVIYSIGYETETATRAQDIDWAIGLIPLMEHARDDILIGRVKLIP